MPPYTAAIVDLGSNTFHLIIVDISNNRFSTKYRERQYTFLSEGGGKFINSERLDHCVHVIRSFSDTIANYKVSTTRVIGTAMLRNAKNRQRIVEVVRKHLNVDVEIIDGIKEADYIYKGIMLFDQFRHGTHLIMDIGGGSTEFIIIKDGEKIWSKSYPLGIGVLYSLFPIDGPASEDQISSLKAYLSSQLYDLRKKLNTIKTIDSIIGSSGSFEVFLSLSGNQHNYEDEVVIIDTTTFDKVYDSIIHSSITDRSEMPNLPQERTKLIVIAMILSNFVFKDLIPSVSIIHFCPYSLKEGVISEMMA